MAAAQGQAQQGAQMAAAQGQAQVAAEPQEKES